MWERPLAIVARGRLVDAGWNPTDGAKAICQTCGSECGPGQVRDAAISAGLGPGYSGESPRMRMAQDMETLGVRLLGEFASGA